MGRYVYIKENKTKPGQLGHWKEQKKMDAVITYLALGSATQTAQLLNIPVKTLHSWKSSDWWKEWVEDIQNESNQKLDNKMSKTMDKALDMLMDRLEDGNYQYDQARGKMVRIPVNAQDAVKITTALFDKRQLIRKQPTTIKSNPETTEARLLKLAQEFAKFVGVKPPEERVVNEHIEGEYHAFYDERQEGLQKGAILGAQEETQSGEGSSLEEQGEGNGGG
jgi:hypothetical protein